MSDIKTQLTELDGILSAATLKAQEIAVSSHELLAQSEPTTGIPFIGLFTAFLLACFIGYFVVWNVTPALHSPLMGVTNAISSVIIVGAIVAAGSGGLSTSSLLGFAAVLLASINIFGGFIVTHRMLQMFKKKPKKV